MRVSLFHVDYVATCSIARFLNGTNQKRKIASLKSRYSHNIQDTRCTIEWPIGPSRVRCLLAVCSLLAQVFHSHAIQRFFEIDWFCSVCSAIFKCMEKHLVNFYLCLSMKYEICSAQIIQTASLAIPLISDCSGWVSFLFAARNTLTLEWLKSSTSYRLQVCWKINENSPIRIGSSEHFSWRFFRFLFFCVSILSSFCAGSRLFQKFLGRDKMVNECYFRFVHVYIANDSCFQPKCQRTASTARSFTFDELIAGVFFSARFLFHFF